MQTLNTYCLISSAECVKSRLQVSLGVAQERRLQSANDAENPTHSALAARRIMPQTLTPIRFLAFGLLFLLRHSRSLHTTMVSPFRQSDRLLALKIPGSSQNKNRQACFARFD